MLHITSVNVASCFVFYLCPRNTVHPMPCHAILQSPIQYPSGRFVVGSQVRTFDLGDMIDGEQRARTAMFHCLSVPAVASFSVDMPSSCWTCPHVYTCQYRDPLHSLWQLAR